MKLTVLGKYGPFPAPGGACSGYLLECGGASLVLDLGCGTLSRLLQFRPALRIDAVLISHLHSDHISDLLVLRYALQQYKQRGFPVPVPLPVVAPDQPEAEYRQLAASGVFDMVAAHDGLRLNIRGVAIRVHRAVHSVPAFAYDISFGGKRLFYTGDTGMHIHLAEQCRGADLLLADACLLDGDKTTEVAAHLTAAEAGRLARDANVKQLLCTHIWGGGYPDEAILREASASCPDALVAEELHQYEI